MLSYKKSVNSSQKYIQDLPTASKTDYYDNSPSKIAFSTPKGKSTNRYGQKVQQAKTQLNQVINQMNIKKSLNDQAIETVSSQNRNLMGYIGQLQSSTNMKPQARQQGNYNSAMPINCNPTHMQQSYQDAGNMHNYNNQGQRNNYQMTLEEENIQLRRALNNQIRQNNNLLKRINFLEAENEQLRNKLGMPSLKNYMNSTFQTNNGNFSPSTMSPTHNFNNRPNYQSFSPKNFQNPEENHFAGVQEYEPVANFGRPRSEMYNPQTFTPKMGGTTPRTHHRVPSELLKELQQLKDYDEGLRQKTINMLKGQH